MRAGEPSKGGAGAVASGVMGSLRKASSKHGSAKIVDRGSLKQQSDPVGELKKCKWLSMSGAKVREVVVLLKMAGVKR